MLRALVRTLAIVPILATVAPFSRTGIGLVRIWDFARTQIAACAAVSLIALRRYGAGSLVDRAEAVGLTLCLAYQLRKIYPYTLLHGTQMGEARGGDDAAHIRLLISNVYMYNEHYRRVCDVIERSNADIVCLVEADHRWEREVRSIEEAYPYTCKCPLGNTYGMLLYSRLPLVDPKVRFLVAPDIPSMRAIVQLRSGDEITLFCVHPRPPVPGSTTYGRDAELVVVGREMRREKRPSIVIGDLNDVAWSYTTTLFQRISHTLDPRIGRGMYNSYHADYPFLRYPLDHIFASDDFAIVELRRLAHAGSDHFPILAELAYTNGSWDQNGEVRLTPYDRRQATEFLERARERDRLLL